MMIHMQKCMLKYLVVDTVLSFIQSHLPFYF
jgi:hypothetical protein